MGNKKSWHDGIFLFVFGGLIIGVFLFLTSCSVSLIPSKDVWYTKHYFIMQKYEQEIYKDLSDAAKQQFQEIFWLARRPAAREIFDKRMEFIIKTYAKENHSQPWNTDRARIFMLNGSPVAIDYKQNVNWAGQIRETGGQNVVTERSGEDVQALTDEIWTYQFGDHLVYYTFSFVQPNEWRLQIRLDQSRYLGELEQFNREKVFGPVNEQEYRQKIEALQKK